MSGLLHAAYAGQLGRFALDVAFEAPLVGVTALFGPSGCGKTSVLRCIAGLSPLPGRLHVGGDVWEDEARGLRRPPHARPVGYVFQEASLFAHLSVRENLRYGMLRRSSAGGDRGPRIGFEEVVTLLGVGSLLGRNPVALSGGERQRVALGRALLGQPELLLMDEPLAALDQAAKQEILPYLDALARELRVPTLYVTHDLSEVERLADHIVLLDAGRVTASAPLADVLADSRLPVARGSAAATVLAARVLAFDRRDGLSSVDVGGATLLVAGRVGEPGSEQRIHIAADDVSLALEPPGRMTIVNVVPARIRQIEPLDAARANVLLELGASGPGARLLARITQRSLRTLALAPGQPVHALVKGVSVVDPRHPLSDS
jgi:molybdate transport system ATP-binding protein